MFIGHFGAGFAAKPAARGVLFLAAQFLDLLWPSLLMLGNVTGPLPPSVRALALLGQAQWLFVLWGFWLDRHRAPVASLASASIARR